MNDNARRRIIGALHEQVPERVVEFADLGAMADDIIASLTSDGDITIFNVEKWRQQLATNRS